MNRPKDEHPKGTRRFAALFAPLFERRALVLLVLIVLAALPGLIQLEWDEADDVQQSKTSPFDFLATHREVTSEAEARQMPESSFASADIEWKSYASAAVEMEDDAEPIDFDCMIEPWETVSVRSPVIGTIDAIHVERADIVAKGDLLLELDADLSKAELEMAEQRAAMTASIRAFEARHSLGSKRSQRASELFARNAMALDERDEVVMEKAVSRYDLEDARDQHKLAQLQLNRERARFEQRRIRSPFDGVVADRMMSVGEVVDEETVLELARIDPLRVEVILPALEFGSIQQGMKAAVVPEIPGDDVLVATVQVVDRVIDSASGTFGAQLELPNPDHSIPGGLRCRVRFQKASLVKTEVKTDIKPEVRAEFDAEVEAEEIARAEPSAP